MSETAEKRTGIEKTWYALDRCVLAVMVVNHTVGDWTAYVGAVPGLRHSEEYRSVANGGSHLPKATAEALFENHLAVTNTERELAGQEWLRWRD